MGHVSFAIQSIKLKPLVGISGCLTGQKVRYDGEAKLLPFYDSLSDYLTWLSFCPEVDAGLGIPRPPVQLVEVKSATQALGVNDKSLNVTRALVSSSQQFWQQNSLSNQTNKLHQAKKTKDLMCGYIFKSRSPSCGLGSTPLFDMEGNQKGSTSGFFAKEAKNHCILAEESWLTSPDNQAIFITACHINHSLLSESSLNIELYDLLFDLLIKDPEGLNTKADADIFTLEIMLSKLTNTYNEKTALNRRLFYPKLTSFWNL
ncbi:MAG: DUF523 domain-containing protein [Cellvibrionaceae bacterium]